MTEVRQEPRRQALEPSQGEREREKKAGKGRRKEATKLERVEKDNEGEINGLGSPRI